MALPKRGELLKLKVVAGFHHHPGEPSLDPANPAKGRGKGKPAVAIRLTALSKLWQSQLSGGAKVVGEDVMASMATMLPIGSVSRGLSATAVLDTGASICAMSTTYAYQTFGETLPWNRKAAGDSGIKLADGKVLPGQKIWMMMEILPTSTPIRIPFLVSEHLDSPVLISWRAIRKFYSFVLKHDHMALCE